MTTRRIANVLVSIALAAGLAANALAHDFTIYRALSGSVARNCVTGPKTAPSEFRIDPDGLSTFQAGENLPANKPYRLRFDVQNAPNDPPQPNDQGTVTGLNGVYTATYTPDYGAGHWSVTIPNATPEQMRNEFSLYARAPGHIDPNTAYDGQPPYCAGAPARMRFRKE